VKQQLDKMFDLLTDASESLEHKNVLPDKVEMNGYELSDNGLLTIDLSANYYEAVTSAKVLCRAAFVKSLTQLDAVDTVSFTVDSQPMVEDDVTLGSMTADSFVDNNTDEDANQVQDVTIYFTNVTGDQLEPIAIPMNLGNNVSAEQLVIEALIDGTQERGYYNTIPEGTKLLSVSTKDTVCYVDFSKEFLNVGDNIKDQTILYSVVNSLCELSTVSKVAFTIEGEQVSLYNGNIAFDQLFERNLDIVDVD
jgi:germination protein M